MTLEVVTPTGEIIRTLPVPRHASGPDLTMLFLGIPIKEAMFLFRGPDRLHP